MGITQQIASGIDIIVHLGRLRDRSRRVLEITEVAGYEDNRIRLNTLYQFAEAGQDNEGNIIGAFEKKSDLLQAGKLKSAGLS